MYYSGITAFDLENVTKLNREYLHVLALGGIAPKCDIERQLGSLVATRRERLARFPILLWSIGERDIDTWSRITERPDTPDLFVDQAASSTALATLGAAAAAFAWQLAQRDSYLPRFFFAASHDWVDLIACAHSFDVVQFVQGQPSLVRPRLASDSGFWEKLLGSAVSRESAVRRAARVSAMQHLLVSIETSDPSAAWPVAARASHQPRLRVADAAKTAADD